MNVQERNFCLRSLKRDFSFKLRQSAMSIGVPVKLLHESVGHIVTVELKTGQFYRGKLADGLLVISFWID